MSGSGSAHTTSSPGKDRVPDFPGRHPDDIPDSIFPSSHSLRPRRPRQLGRLLADVQVLSLRQEVVDRDNSRRQETRSYASMPFNVPGALVPLHLLINPRLIVPQMIVKGRCASLA